MCGIAGLAGRLDPHDARTRAAAMTRLLEHRGPDGTGGFEADGVWLGHTRLAVIDLSEAANQPMFDRDNVLIFNGEIYNFKDLRKSLEVEGVIFSTNSDSEVLLKGYRAWGRSIVERLDGMFAFVIWDAARRSLFCARDRFGEKPFYFFSTDGTFSFASEVEALVAGLDRRPDLDAEALGDYLLRGYYRPGRSIYRGVRTLEAGSWLTFDVDAERLQTGVYGKPQFEPGDQRVASKDLVERTGTELSAAVRRCMISDVPLGVLLSGGIDSSLIALKAGEAIPAFTVTYPGSNLDEASFARQVAQRAGNRHVEIPLESPSLAKLAGEIVRCYGEPFGDLSAAPTYSLFRRIAGEVTVTLSGEGGDELFDGYLDGRLFALRHRLHRQPSTNPPVMASVARLLESPSRTVRRVGYAIGTLTLSGPSLAVSLFREGWTAANRARALTAEGRRLIGERTPEDEVGRSFAAGGSEESQRYLNFALERLTQAYLVKVDRASMAHSIEARCPFLLKDMFNLVRDLAGQSAYWPESKWPLKELASRRFGRGFASRRKMGFTPPMGDWLRNTETVAWMRGLFFDRQAFVPSIFDKAAIDRMIDAHLAGESHQGRLWRLAQLELWHRLANGRGVAHESLAKRPIFESRESRAVFRAEMHARSGLQ